MPSRASSAAPILCASLIFAIACGAPRRAEPPSNVASHDHDEAWYCVPRIDRPCIPLTRGDALAIRDAIVATEWDGSKLAEGGITKDRIGKYTISITVEGGLELEAVARVDENGIEHGYMLHASRTATGWAVSDFMEYERPTQV